MNTRLTVLVTWCVLLVTGTLGFSIQQGAPAVRRLDTKHLSNAIEVAPDIISGALPDQEESFAELRELGVKTIISVDGMRPDLRTAHNYGMQYVHFPNGYDGIPPSRVLELAKAIRDLPKPIYVHCHHGKHRSPAAVAAACVTLRLISHEQAFETLKLAGTNSGFKGLFESVRRSQPTSDSVLDSLPIEYHQISPVPPIAEMMVAVDDVMSRLVLAKKQNWPKLDSNATDALMLKEHLVELGRLDETKIRSKDFQKLLNESASLIDSLENELRRASDVLNTTDSKFKASSLLIRAEDNCLRCHEQFRN